MCQFSPVMMSTAPLMDTTQFVVKSSPMLASLDSPRER